MFVRENQLTQKFIRRVRLLVEPVQSVGAYSVRFLQAMDDVQGWIAPTSGLFHRPFLKVSVAYPSDDTRAMSDLKNVVFPM